MDTTVMITALPITLAGDTGRHLTAFVTHKLVPDAPPPDEPDRVATLADFPAVADWVTTLAGCTLTLATSQDPDREIPLRVVSDPVPDAAAWTACLPATVPVAGFPVPSYVQQEWRSLPASRLSDHAIDLHLAAATASPTRRPGVQGNPVAEAALDTIAQVHLSPALRGLRATQDERAGRDAAILQRRTADAVTTIGPLTEGLSRVERLTGPPLPPYQSEVSPAPSPVEILLDDTDGETALTGRLDALLAEGVADGADPQLRQLIDAHAARRYYERPDEPEQPARRQPLPDAPPAPRPAVPQHDFHERVGGFGSTPVLLRRLGLAVDLVVDDPDPHAQLAGATWISIRMTPPEGSGITVLPPRRTSVVVDGDVFSAASSAEWVGGALPLADSTWRVLDLDPDAAGLKLDQHYRGLVRRLAVEANGDPATSAPATLRSSGFAIARVDRAAATRGRVAAAETLAADDGTRELRYDDLVRGIRVEVWDDVTKSWHSLHRRRVTVWGTAGEAVLEDAEDVGFLQLSALNRNPSIDGGPLYIHEVVAGWDGWGLSVPRPGKVIVHVEPPAADGSTEVVVDNAEDATGDASAGGIRVRSRVAPGSLPRLRYGTSYSFRLRGVDLAGNVVPQPAAQEVTEAVVAAAREHLDQLRAELDRRDAAGLSASLRERIVAHLDQQARPVAEGGPVSGEDEVALPAAMRTGQDGVDRSLGLMLRLARARAARDEVAAPDLLAEAARAAGVVAGAARPWRVHPQLTIEPRALAELAGPAGLRSVTAPRPYLRWDPVPFPALVPRRELSTGEQLSRLVVRSGLDDGARRDVGAGPDDQATSERHVAPPKATQLEAEAAGRFDAAIGTGDAAEVNRLYRLALVEQGTFLDRSAPNPADPFDPIDQPDIALVSRPGADPATAVTLEPGAAEYTRGAALGEGQYVVHDVDALRLPYLPDPYAHGATLLLSEAGAPHLLPEPRVLQSVTIPYPGTWPDLQPLRLVLDRSEDPDAVLGARVVGHEVHVTVPRGESVRATLSSSVRREDLDRFGMWRSQLAGTLVPGADGGLTQDQLAAAEALMRAAASGWTWWLTPSTDLLLVHAVPRPVRPPRLISLRMLMRPPGRGIAALAGVADVHGPSTGRLLLRASWTKSVDEPTSAGPAVVARTDIVTDSQVGARERSGLFGLVDFQPTSTPVDLADGTIGLHAAVQKFPDTHHRVVTYTPSGTTRYRELFDAADLPADDDPLLAGEPITLDVPSSARPAVPVVLDTVPLLRWERLVEPAQPFALRSVRRSGVRLWLARPWFSSGDGELLGVLTFEPYEPDPDNPGQQRLKAVQARDNATSLWGRDPLAVAGGGGDLRAATNPPLVPLRDVVLGGLLNQIQIEPQPAARPVAVALAVPLVDHAGFPTVRVFGYAPEYDETSGRWFVDVALEDGPALWPFVRLAVARYQPSSLPGMALSAVALSSWVQPLPTRSLTVSRQGPERIQLTLTGTISLLHGLPRAGLSGDLSEDEEITGDTPTGTAAKVAAIVRLSRRVRVSVQQLPDGASDLGWSTVTRAELRTVSVAPATWQATWTGSLQLPAGSGTPAGDAAGLPVMQTPGTSVAWRVLVEEHEVLDGDDPGTAAASVDPVPIERLVFADTVPL